MLVWPCDWVWNICFRNSKLINFIELLEAGLQSPPGHPEKMKHSFKFSSSTQWQVWEKSKQHRRGVSCLSAAGCRSAAATVVIEFTWAAGATHFNQWLQQSHVWTLSHSDHLRNTPLCLSPVQSFAGLPPLRLMLLSPHFRVVCVSEDHLNLWAEAGMASEKERNGLDNYAFTVSKEPYNTIISLWIECEDCYWKMGVLIFLFLSRTM